MKYLFLASILFGSGNVEVIIQEVPTEDTCTRIHEHILKQKEEFKRILKVDSRCFPIEREGQDI